MYNTIHFQAYHAKKQKVVCTRNNNTTPEAVSVTEIKHTHNFDKQQHPVCVGINQINTTIVCMRIQKQQTVCVRINNRKQQTVCAGINNRKNNKQFVHG